MAAFVENKLGADAFGGATGRSRRKDPSKSNRKTPQHNHRRASLNT
jgi:hypothetical protein